VAFDDYLLMFCRMTIALLFGVSAWGKVRDVASFSAAVESLVGVRHGWSRLVAAAVIGAEVAVVVALTVGGASMRVGFAISLVLLVSFTAVLASAVRRGVDVGCACFGARRPRVSVYDIARNVLMIATAVTGLGLVASADTVTSASALAVIVIMSAAFVVCVVNLKDLIGGLTMEE
jgi:hypothetical protein